MKKPHDDSFDVVQGLTTNKIGRPLLLGNDLDKQVREYVKYLRECVGVFNTAVVMTTAEGLVVNKNVNLLLCNGGGILLTKSWVKYLVECMCMVKRKASTKANVGVIRNSDIDVSNPVVEKQSIVVPNELCCFHCR